MEIAQLEDSYLDFFYLAVNKLINWMQDILYLIAEHSDFTKYTLKTRLNYLN